VEKLEMKSGSMRYVEQILSFEIATYDEILMSQEGGYCKTEF
jgi:hypothetical protein